MELIEIIEIIEIISTGLRTILKFLQTGTGHLTPGQWRGDARTLAGRCVDSDGTLPGQWRDITWTVADRCLGSGTVAGRCMDSGGTMPVQWWNDA